MEPWNNSELPTPPIHTCQIKDDIDINELRHICSNISKILTKQSPLHREGAILSRFIYKFDKKFRHDIGYSKLKKVYTALKKYHAMNLMKDINNFIDTLPKNKNESYYPTRQMLECVLIKLMTFSKIVLRINVCSKQSAIFYLDRIKRGDTHWMCLMPYALLSRIWSITKVLLHHSVQWYTHLYKYLEIFQHKGLKYLPDNFTLPDNIKLWLDLDNIDNIGRCLWKQKKCVDIDPTLMSNDDGDELINLLGFVNQINKDDDTLDEITETVEQQISCKQLQIIKSEPTDAGEVISRESFNVLHNFHNKMKYSQCSHTFEHVTNTKMLDDFIEKEELFRNENNKLSLTSHLSLMQWHALKKTLHNCSKLLGTRRKIQKKMQKIWKERCLDYLE